MSYKAVDLIALYNFSTQMSTSMILLFTTARFKIYQLNWRAWYISVIWILGMGNKFNKSSMNI